MQIISFSRLVILVLNAQEVKASVCQKESVSSTPVHVAAVVLRKERLTHFSSPKEALKSSKGSHWSYIFQLWSFAVLINSPYTTSKWHTSSFSSEL